MRSCFLLCLALCGCQSAPVQTEIIWIRTPESLLKPCVAPVPPEVQSYLKQTLSQRESSLAVYSLELLRSLKDCDDQITAIKELQSQILKKKE